MRYGVKDYEHDEYKVERNEAFDDREDRALHMAGRAGRADQLRGPAEVGSRTGGGDLAAGFTLTHNRCGVCGLRRACIDGKGFARQRRLVERHHSIEQHQIGWDDIARPDVHYIAGDQLRGGQTAPMRIPQYPRVDLQLAAQQRQCVVRAALLYESDDGIENEQKQDDQRLLGAAKHYLQHDHRFKHPWHRPPKLSEELAPWWRANFPDGVSAEQLKTTSRLGRRKSCRTVGFRQRLSGLCVRFSGGRHEKASLGDGERPFVLFSSGPV